MTRADPPTNSMPRPGTRFRIRRSALIEIALFFALAFGIDAVDGSLDRFAAVDPHPYWLIVVAVAAQYGTTEGILAAFAATAALLAWNLPAATVGQDQYDHILRVARLPGLWLSTATALGELRLRQIRERDRLRTDLDKARLERETIAKTYAGLRTVKENLETRVAGHMRTVASLYRAARTIDHLEEGEVLMGVSGLLRAVLSPEKSSLFLLNDDALSAVTVEGWSADDRFARSFDHESQIYRVVVGERRFLCAAYPDDERILLGEGLLAGPLIAADTGELVGMIKIESIGFMEFNVASVESFHILCEWVGTALARARRYAAARANRVLADDGSLFTSNYIERQAVFLARLGKRFGFETTMITIRPAVPRLSPEARSALAEAIATATREGLRATDLAAEHRMVGNEYGVVLPGATIETARRVAARLEAGVREALPPAHVDLPFTLMAEAVTVE